MPELARSGSDSLCSGRCALCSGYPSCTDDGCRCALIRGQRFTEAVLTSGQLDGPRLVRFFVWLFSRLLSDPWIQVHGLVMVEDLQGMAPWSSLIQFWRSLDASSKKLLKSLVQGALPIRWAAFYLMNVPPTVKTGLLFARPFLGQKIRSRIVMSSQVGSLLAAYTTSHSTSADTPPGGLFSFSY
jgi:hypothetical protein